MVTDRRRLGPGEQESLQRLRMAAAVAVRAGVDLVQVRETDLDDRRLLRLVGDLLEEVRGTAARVLVNERLDVALAAGAHGVHLRSASVAAPRVRSLVPGGFLVGRSVHSREEAAAVERAGGCDYLIFGTVFPSASKSPGHAIAGLAALAEVCAAVDLPVLAIGGVTEQRAAAVAASGAAGFAAIDLFARLTERDGDTLRETIGRMRTAFRP